MISRLVHYSKKVAQVGFWQAAQVVRNRALQRMSVTYWRYQVQRGTAAHTWDAIKRAHAIEYDFIIFFERNRLRSLSCVPLLLGQQSDISQLKQQADKYVQKNFSILGSTLQQYAQIPWHTDIRLAQERPDAEGQFSAEIFYKDIAIHAGQHTRQKDIKVPWELSRGQHLVILAHAYQQTGQTAYADAVAQQITDWLDNNPYLQGVNWVCPMEVGLRAVNWVIAYELCKDAPTIPLAFWQRFVCSLYDHMIYLEHNWEVYDGRTSNHYLSDLVGYFYLCWFFRTLPGVQNKQDLCYQELLAECNKQVFPEGTNYEGSTAYHALVTELFVHAQLLMQESDCTVPDWFAQRIACMLTFIDWCTPTGGSLVTIGDNDSGRVLYAGITDAVKQHVKPSNQEDKKSVAQFNQFGLSIIKTDAWHITLRQHAYHPQQPSGHFHNDVGSVTLAHHGIPIIVDPGSYLYTPSIYWRNYFRSVTVHNTCYIANHEPVPLDDRLFALDLAQADTTYVPLRTQEGIRLTSVHNLYGLLGLRAERTVLYNEQAKQVTITDTWQQHSTYTKTIKQTACWNFILAPTITAVPHNNGWVLQYNGEPLLSMHSNVVFEQHDAWTSPAYGAKVKTTCLRAKQPLCIGKSVTIRFSV